MIDGQDYKRLLHSHRMKSTKPRNAVLSVLGEKDCALTAEEIYRALVQKGDGVNFSTVYRVLELFAEKRLVTKTFFSDSSRAVSSSSEYPKGTWNTSAPMASGLLRAVSNVL